MKLVNQDEALAEIFDGENVYVIREDNKNFLLGDEQITEVDGVEYARLVSHEEVESIEDGLYIEE